MHVPSWLPLLAAVAQYADDLGVKSNRFHTMTRVSVFLDSLATIKPFSHSVLSAARFRHEMMTYRIANRRYYGDDDLPYITSVSPSPCGNNVLCLGSNGSARVMAAAATDVCAMTAE